MYLRRQVFLLLTCGALLELEEIAGAVVQEYIDAEAEKQGLHVIVWDEPRSSAT